MQPGRVAMHSEHLRLILVPQKANDELFARNRDDPDRLRGLLQGIAEASSERFVERVRVFLAPMIRFVDAGQRDLFRSRGPDREFPEPLVAISFSVPLRGEALKSWLAGYAERLASRTGTLVQSDLPLRPAFWTPGQAFGRRSQARRLIGMDRLGLDPPQHKVNVVIVDQGFDAQLFPGRFGDSYGGGAVVDGRMPGQGSSRHAAMIARTVLDIAPDATLFDFPLIPTPPRGAGAVINDLPVFTSDAASLFRQFLTDFIRQDKSPEGFGQWVFVNAWAVFDSRSDLLQPHYSTDRLHVLNQTVLNLAGQGFDMVFAAGNCGQFDPDRRCRPEDTGPCRSILGANSLKEVLTASAARVDASLLGYSSQGPGQPDLGAMKPDFYAPTQFADDNDAAEVSGGTSAAAAVAAGVVAALRSRWHQIDCSSADLKITLTTTARQIPALFPGAGAGIGLIDAAAAAASLLQSHP